MYCTTVYLEKRILYRCLFFILSIGLLLQFVIPLQSQERWDEALLVQTRSRGWVRRARSRRWVRRRGRCRQGVKSLSFLKRRGKVVLCRLGLVAILLMWHGWPQRQPLAWGLLSLPLADAVLSLLPLLWPSVLKVRAYLHLTRGVQELYRLTVVVLCCVGLFRFLLSPKHAPWALLAGGGVRTADGAWARGEIEEDGTWHLEIEGHITITWKPRNFFEERILLILFRQVRTPQSTPKRPFLRQEWLAEWFGTKQEWISRWQKYVRQGGLEKLNGEHTNWVVTPEIRQAILDIWVPDFWLGADQVRQRLLAAGHISSVEDISEPSIHRVAQEAGFAEVRRLLRQTFTFSADGPQWRDGVLIDRLFELNERLVAQLQKGGGLTPQVRLEIESLKQGLGVPATPPTKPLPYAYHLQQALFGQAEEMGAADDQPISSIRCPHCGSALVHQKENTPRHKKYRDPQTGAWCEVEGYRCYCHNPDCEPQTFTNYPDGVRLYSSWTMDTVIWGVMVYMRMRTTYRLAAEAVGVSHVTLWRWAMAVGEHALPVAALFGAVRSSGVVGIDEKWVLVPKNNKPPGKRKRWMYVYMAVDVFTYDLLHIDIYPYNGKQEAHAFLQALKAKGYCPQVIVTDMCQDYDEPVRLVFPGAVHHECVFHALQWAQRLVKDVYGNNYAETHLEAVTLKDKIYRVFKAKSKKTVNKRYREVMALKAQYVAHRPESQRIFDFLERHYPKLVNAVENPLIPLTNNTVELVNRRFAQHYQNMCGFDGIETARNYLHLFELTYRFTPFVKDNRPVEGRELDIRGKCPLELAGYDISHIPIAQVVRGQLLGWPPRTLQRLVPSM
jgi:transposase-like protein